MEDKDKLSEIIIKTLETISIPLELNVLFELLINPGKTVNKEEFLIEIHKLLKNSELIEHNGYFLLPTKDISTDVQHYLELRESIKVVIKKIIKNENFLVKIGSIKYLGVYSPIANIKTKPQTG
jgi:hypothetical protein